MKFTVTTTIIAAAVLCFCVDGPFGWAFVAIKAAGLLFGAAAYKLCKHWDLYSETTNY